MSRPMPEHGTRARYMRGCRCTDCYDANGRYCKAYRTHAHRTGGLSKRLNPAPVTRRIRYWESQGYSHGQIARAAGVARRVVDAHAKGELPSINPDSARRILAVRLNDSVIPDYLPVNSVGTVRRLRALAVLGHRVKDIAAASGHMPGALSKILNGHSTGVRGATAQDIATVYEAWQHQAGPCERTRRRAAREGWHGPDAWDDNIDDPAAEPERPLTARQQAQQRTAEIVLLATAGATPEQIAARTGLSVDYVRDRFKAELPTTYRALANRQQRGPKKTTYMRSAA